MSLNYVLQAAGDRFYLNETVKLRIGLIERLKKMNETYPKMHLDYDSHFMAHIMNALFTREELERCVHTGLIKHFSIAKMKLIKRKLIIFNTQNEITSAYSLSSQAYSTIALKMIHNDYETIKIALLMHVNW